MPYQSFDFVQKDFIEYKKASALWHDVVHKKNNLDDLTSRQKNTTVGVYRPALRYINLQTEQSTSSIKGNKIEDMDYKLESKSTSLNTRLATIDEEFQANIGVSDISFYNYDLFQYLPFVSLLLLPFHFNSNNDFSVSDIPNSDDDIQFDNANSANRRYVDDDSNDWTNVQHKKKNTQHSAGPNTENKCTKVKIKLFYNHPIKIWDNLHLTLKIHASLVTSSSKKIILELQ